MKFNPYADVTTPARNDAMSATLTPSKINRINKMYRCGFTRCDISRIVGIAVTRVPMCPKDIKVPNLAANYKSKRKPPISINPTELNSMITMRNRGDTLESIAVAINRSTATVFRHTRHIVNARRRNRDDVINRKTGAFLRCCR